MNLNPNSIFFSIFLFKKILLETISKETTIYKHMFDTSLLEETFTHI